MLSRCLLDLLAESLDLVVGLVASPARGASLHLLELLLHLGVQGLDGVAVPRTLGAEDGLLAVEVRECELWR